MSITVDGKKIHLTDEGFVIDKAQWTPAVAEAIANAQSIELTPQHWEIIDVLNSYCDNGEAPPSMRLLSRAIKNELAAEKARSIYLMKLFGSSPAKACAQIAGLPKPKNCL